MKFPFVSRAIYEACEAERRKLLDLILKHQLGDTLYSEQAEKHTHGTQNAPEINPEKFAEAREEVKEAAKATFQSFISRRPSAIVADQSRKKELEYRKKYTPNQNANIAMFEAAEREIREAQA